MIEMIAQIFMFICSLCAIMIYVVVRIVVGPPRHRVT
jgi:hypothetical protein